MEPASASSDAGTIVRFPHRHLSMKWLGILLIAALAAGEARPAVAQATSPTRVRFDRLDANGDGQLWRGELARCGCHSLDADADETVTFEEFQRPTPAAVGVYRLVEIAGHPLPVSPPGDNSGIEVSA